MDNGGAAFFFFFVILIIIWIFALSGSVRERRARVILGYQPVVENLEQYADYDGIPGCTQTAFEEGPCQPDPRF